MANQIPFNFSKTRFTAHDFEIGSCNTDAAKLVKAWPEWPAPILALFGPSGVGKTHLGHIWAKAAQAASFLGPDFTSESMEGARRPIFLDEAAKTPEPVLFKLLNMALNGDIAGLLMADRFAPRLWSYNLPDVQSRLRNVQAVELQDHDDALLEPIVRKLFKDQGRDASADIVHYMLKHCDRSVDHMRMLVAQLDLAARRENADLTKRFVARFLRTRTDS